MNRLFFIIGLMTVIVVGNELDYSFGVNGKIKSGCNDVSSSVINSILVQPDDKVITVGTEWRGDDRDGYRIIALYRYLPDGSKDLTFGNNGAVYADHICADPDTCGRTFGLGGEMVRNAVLQPNGKIVVQTDGAFSVARFNENGSLDTDFGQHGGFAFQNTFVYASSNRMTLEDGKVLVVGYMHNGDHNYNVALMRYTDRGVLDSTFGTAGSITTDISTSDNGNDVSVQDNGKIVVVGDVNTNPPECDGDNQSRGLLLRYDSNGTLDTSFDGDGIKLFNVSAIFDAVPTDPGTVNSCQGSYFGKVEIMPDGKIIVLGGGFNSPISFFLARFNAGGSLDTTFGYQGARAMYTAYDYDIYNHGSTVFTYHGMSYDEQNMKVLKNQKIAVTGKQYGGSYNGSADRFLAVRFNTIGNFDHIFGPYGRTIINPDPDDYFYYGTNSFDISEQSSGKLLMGGWVGGTSDTCQFYGSLMRLEKDKNMNPSIIMYLLN